MYNSIQRMNNERSLRGRRSTAHRRGLNWGLVAIAEFDLVAWIFGEDFGTTNAASRIVYGLVGLAAVYGIAALPPGAGRRGPTAGDRSSRQLSRAALQPHTRQETRE